jgi:hypothetical protein
MYDAINEPKTTSLGFLSNTRICNKVEILVLPSVLSPIIKYSK